MDMIALKSFDDGNKTDPIGTCKSIPWIRGEVCKCSGDAAHALIKLGLVAPASDDEAQRAILDLKASEKAFLERQALDAEREALKKPKADKPAKALKADKPAKAKGPADKPKK